MTTTIAQGEVPVIADTPKVDVDVKVEEKADEVSFDPVALKEKYRSERDKRLARGQGVEQYTLIEGHLNRFITDPWIEPGFTRDPIEEETDVVIVGGGYGAQIVAVRLLEEGITNFKIIEKAGGFGGTWYWNRYPGARCDIESYIYMPLLEEIGYMPTEKYAGAKELLKHSGMIGEKFDLYSRALFQTETHEMRWDEAEGKWTTFTSRGDKIKSRFIVPAAGPLHRPKLPGLKDIEDFKGHAFHSSRWDFNYTGGDPTGNLHKLKDKRIGIIGTGATAVQIIPHLGEWAKQVYVFQRTPSSIDVRGNRPTDETWAASLEKGWQRKRMDNFDSIINGGMEEEDMVADRWTDIVRELITKTRDYANTDMAAQRQLVDFQKMEQIRARCDAVVKDKETAEALKPWYNQFCKRPCFHDEYLETFNRPNVKLVDTKGQGVDRLSEKGVVANGEEYEIDCLIYATGFELANSWTHKTGIEIHGRDGLTISDKWKEGSSTLHGWASRGFPNCLWVQIVQAALTPNFMHVTNEQAIHFAHVISECLKKGIRTIEPTQEAEEAWCKTIVDGAAVGREFFQECTPGYYNNEGKMTMYDARNSAYAHGSPAFIKILKDWRSRGDMPGLDVQYSKENDATPQTNGVERTNGTKQTNGVEEHDKAPNTEDPTASLMQKFADLQMRHQAEIQYVLAKQKQEVDTLLAKHAKKDSVTDL